MCSHIRPTFQIHEGCNLRGGRRPMRLSANTVQLESKGPKPEAGICSTELTCSVLHADHVGDNPLGMLQPLPALCHQKLICWSLACYDVVGCASAADFLAVLFLCQGVAFLFQLSRPPTHRITWKRDHSNKTPHATDGCSMRIIKTNSLC
mmetsp:Transcript_33041/g.68179  ORF Transcript_33041/g.68179 Transcript_33041/m.68179 type:complete len:150 (-) Transcript_33041:46-495(-)